MNIFTRLFKGNKEKGYGFTTNISINDFISGNYNLNLDVPKLTYQQEKLYYQGLIASAIDFRANSVKKGIPLIYQYVNQTSDNEIDYHPFIDVIRDPNKDQSFTEILETTSKNLDIHGNSYWYIVKNKLGTPLNIYVLEPTSIKIELENGYIKSYRQRIEHNKYIDYSPEDIIHFKTYNSNSQLYGISLIQKAVIPIEIDLKLSIYQTNLLSNDGRLKGYYKGATSRTKEDVERQTNKKYAGVENAGKVPALPKDLEYVKLQESPNELDYVNSKQAVKKEILNITQVPESALGAGDSTNKSTAGINIQTFNHNVIIPVLQDISEQISKYIRKSYNDKSLSLKFNLPLPQDREADLKEMETLLRYGLLTPNEVREFYSWDTLKDDKYNIPIESKPSANNNSNNTNNTNNNNQE